MMLLVTEKEVKAACKKPALGGTGRENGEIEL